ncbi:HicA protein (fragment) [Xenorhabdus bovienii str. puntauvense]|uniref:HicA protein n=3 Tax=Xenorhabdus bovienii TaxID=40576 RepID=A0A0B6XD26_XENBV
MPNTLERHKIEALFIALDAIVSEGNNVSILTINRRYDFIRFSRTAIKCY